MFLIEKETLWIFCPTKKNPSITCQFNLDSRHLNELELEFESKSCQRCSQGHMGVGGSGKETNGLGLETSGSFSFSVVYFGVLHKILPRINWGVLRRFFESLNLLPEYDSMCWWCLKSRRSTLVRSTMSSIDRFSAAFQADGTYPHNLHLSASFISSLHILSMVHHVIPPPPPLPLDIFSLPSQKQKFLLFW